MKPIARQHAPGPGRAGEPDPSLEAEQALVAAEDARAEAAALAGERDSLAIALREARAALRGRDGEIAALRADLAESKRLVALHQTTNSAATEELEVAMEELRASAVSFEEANDDLSRLNADLERRVAARTAALAESETRLRAATDAVPHLVWTSDAAGMWTWANRRWVEYTGQSSDDSTGFGWLERVHPDDRDETTAAWRRAGTAGAFHVEHRLCAADGSYRWFSTRALPERPERGHEDDGPREGGPAADGDAQPAWYGTSTDVEDARRAEAALRESEARFRGFAETSEDVLWIMDGAGRRLEYLSPAFERVWGTGRAAVVDDLARWAALVHPDDRPAVLGALPRVLRGERVQVEYRILRASDGAERWIHDTGFPIRDAAGRIERVAGLAQDVTEQREAEQRQRTLLNELNHRVKNALAGAQALAAHTARGAGAASGSPGAFVRAFEERLRALARAHDMLTREGWRGASLAEVVRETLAPHGAGSGRIAMSGPGVRLAPGAAVALHMAFHELATNAAKYGALSVPGGRVEVAWAKLPGEAEGARGVLAISWRERDGPPVARPPVAQGFGARLLERGLPQQLGGEAVLDFAPAGLEFGLRLPLSERVQAS